MSVSPPAQDLGSAITTNRRTFVEKWRHLLEPSLFTGEVLAARANEALQNKVGKLAAFNQMMSKTYRKTKSIAFFIPYEIVPGGGENYCLSIAEYFSHSHDIFFVVPDHESLLRVLSVITDLGYDHIPPRVITLTEAERRPAFDIFFLLGNEILPVRGSLGIESIYICQFPFPQPVGHVGHFKKLGYYQQFSRYFVYSEYVQRHVSMQLKEINVMTPVCVLPPTVSFIGSKSPAFGNKIISVGRFFVGGHNKRHDVMIEAFSQLVSVLPSASLTLAGAVHKDSSHRKHLAALRKEAEGLPVSFYVDVNRDVLDDLYRDAKIYWHAGGWGVDVDLHPEQVEHFGIAIVEAMSAGCIPIVYAIGGPLEIVKHGINGIAIASVDEFVYWTTTILNSWDTQEIRRMRSNAVETARKFDKQSFAERLRNVFLN